MYVLRTVGSGSAARTKVPIPRSERVVVVEPLVRRLRHQPLGTGETCSQTVPLHIEVFGAMRTTTLYPHATQRSSNCESSGSSEFVRNQFDGRLTTHAPLEL
jgi:hypothetical protein